MSFTKKSIIKTYNIYTGRPKNPTQIIGIWIADIIDKIRSLVDFFTTNLDIFMIKNLIIQFMKI